LAGDCQLLHKPMDLKKLDALLWHLLDTPNLDPNEI
jgi:hypothetical protein